MQDSNPERRNLTVLSAAIVIYYLAGGSIDPSHLKLGLVDMHFSNPVALKYILWTSLAWFLYRHILVNYSNFINDLQLNLQTMDVNWIAKFTVQKTAAFKEQYAIGDAEFIGDFKFVLDRINENNVIIHNINGQNFADSLNVSKHNIAKFFYKWLVLTKATFRRPVIFGFYMAPLLTILAVVLAILR